MLELTSLEFLLQFIEKANYLTFSLVEVMRAFIPNVISNSSDWEEKDYDQSHQDTEEQEVVESDLGIVWGIFLLYSNEILL